MDRRNSGLGRNELHKPARARLHHQVDYCCISCLRGITKPMQTVGLDLLNDPILESTWEALPGARSVGQRLNFPLAEQLPH